MQKIHSVILAAGLSRRMNSAHTNKVCLQLAGSPVIMHTLNALVQNNITEHTVVLGACADRVLEAMENFSGNISYAFQPFQHGAADALRCAVESLETADPETLLLVVPGHRIISGRILEDFYNFYRSEKPLIAELVLDDKARNLKQNLSIALGTVQNIKLALKKFDFENPPKELAIADLAEAVNPAGSRWQFTVSDFQQVPGFNNPEEFLLVAELLRKQRGTAECCVNTSEYHPVKEWLDSLSNPQSALCNVLQDFYGSDTALTARQSEALKKLLTAAENAWNADTPVSVIRSPGRVNAMGRHIDHQGGNCNLMTIGYETLIAARVRQDDCVTLHNLDSEFAPVEFSIGDLVRDLPWDDWQKLVGSKKLARLLKQYGVNWADYIKAVFLRFQKHFDDKKLHGMDMIVSGNVPMAAGLSSSSTLVVGAAEAVVGANRLDLEPDKLVTLCGEGEWFVGTRGGSADHAAVKLGECNKIVKVGFFDFRVEEMVDFPAGYTLIVGDSGIKARKSGNAKDQFNHRIACYRTGLLLLKKFFPQYAGKVSHLRDFNCRNLNIPLDWLYTLLMQLPERATRKELQAMLPEENLNIFWQNHNAPADGIYPVRGVVLFGLAECERAARYVNMLKQNIAEAGEMMNISHDGDRVSRFDPTGNLLEDFYVDTSDAALTRLASDLRSNDAAKIAAAQLWRQPGSYRCSLPEIDLMTDLARSVPGVLGAQLAGAGLGGCMMVLTRTDAIEELYKVLEEKYYSPRNLPVKLLQCRPVAGAGAIRF